jgi:hypothetical protein
MSIDQQNAILTNAIAYHKDLFINDNLIDKKAFILSYGTIIDTYFLFKAIDKNFSTDLLDKLYIDIESLINLVDRNFNQKDLVKKCLINQNTHIDFTIKVTDEDRDILLQIIHIINAKLYYFDMAIWKHTKSSLHISKFVESYTSSDIAFSNDFAKLFPIPVQLKPTIEFDIYTEYTKREINFINALNHEIYANKEKILAKLLNAKDKFSFFNNLHNEEILKAIKNVKIFTFHKGEAVINQGQTDYNIYLLLSGECIVIVHGKRIATITKGQVFGELASITKMPRTAKIEANETSKLITFHINTQLALDESHIFVKLYSNIINALSNKIININEQF